jgi:SOS-response transcriptional repressor LexA
MSDKFTTHAPPSAIPERKEVVLQAIKDYRASHHGISPTVRDLMELTGITSSSLVLYYLDKLEAEKAIIRYHGVARGISVA